MGKTPQQLRDALEGIIGFGVTPIAPDLTIETMALRKNARALAEVCEVVVPLGNNGEVHSLSPEEQEEVGKIVVEEIAGRRPVVIGMGHSLPVCLALAAAAERNGADGILILPPVVSHASEDGVYQYYRRIAEATSLGVLLFQTPTWNFSVPLLRRLAQVPNIVGMKDEHGDMKQFVHQFGALRDQLELVCGVGEILAPSYFALGVRAFTSGIVNFAPDISRRILALVQSGRFTEATRDVEELALPIFKLRGRRPGYITAVIKEAMNLCGLGAGTVRPPLCPMAAEDREDLRAVLHQLKLEALQ
jgi:dihydrodipicolinate synthase/N-acetylneuraminate lyase